MGPPVRKSLGQHFLSDKRILTRIVDALEPRPDETIIEIGPGRGALTDILKGRAARVVAIEYDRQLAALLRERYAGTNVEIVEADVLTVDLGAIARGPYGLIGNVPYYITTPILFHALRPPRASRAVYLVQREVADRMSASAADDDYGALTVNLQAIATVKTIFRVPRGAFHPPPKVESAVVRVTPRADPVIAPNEEPAYREMVQAAFGMRRKQMRRVLRELYGLDAAEADAVLRVSGIEGESRPEVVTPRQFAELLRRLPASSRDS